MSHKDEQWVFYKNIEGKLTFPGEVSRIMAYCDAAMCVVNELEVDAIVPMHSHSAIQICYIAEGCFLFTIDDVEKEVTKGDTLCIQDELKHGCVCLEKGVLVDFFTPMREDLL